MTKVRQLLEEKGGDLWSIAPDGTVYEAIETMAEHGIGALLVMEGDEPVGIVSERDYARKVILKGRSSRDTPVRDIMTVDVVYARPDQSTDELLTMMTEKRIRHLPIRAGGKLFGMISIGDLVKSIIGEQRALIKELEQYIQG